MTLPSETKSSSLPLILTLPWVTRATGHSGLISLASKPAHLGGEVHLQLAHGGEDVAGDPGVEGLGQPGVHAELLQGAVEGAGDHEGRVLRVVVRGLGAEVDRVGAHGGQVAFRPQLEGGAVHAEAAHVEDVVGALAPGVQGDLVQLEGRLGRGGRSPRSGSGRRAR